MLIKFCMPIAQDEKINSIDFWGQGHKIQYGKNIVNKFFSCI